MIRGGMLRRWLARTSIALYALFLVAAPFGHHDLICHLKHPLHCTVCMSSQLGSDPQTLSAPRASTLADAGRAFVSDRVCRGTLLPVRPAGRSPPTSC
jgi:hypothetical protein